MTDKVWKVDCPRGLGQNNKNDARHGELLDNWVPTGDELHARRGSVQVAKWENAIRAMKDVYVDGTAYVLVYAGKRFWLRRKDDEEGEWADVTTSGVTNGVDTDRLTDTPIDTHSLSGKTYIVGCGDYLVLKSVEGAVQLVRVQDDSDTYIPTTRVGILSKGNTEYVRVEVDRYTVGEYWVEDNGGWVKVTLDGDTAVPDEGRLYYRQVKVNTKGQKAEDSNRLQSYRKNTMFGSESAPASYVLDGGHIDADSETVVKLCIVGEGGGRRNITLTEQDGDTVTRPPVVGDRLDGKRLHWDSVTVTNVGALRLTASTVGLSVLATDNGLELRWEADGPAVSDWNNARLVLRQHGEEVAVPAQATRSNLWSRYTVTFTAGEYVLAADCGTVTSQLMKLTAIETCVQCDELTPLVSSLKSGAEVWGEIDYANGILTLNRPCPPPDMQDNIEILYRCRTDEADPEPVLGAKVSATFGVQGNDDRLFAGGSDAAPGMDCHSAAGDWTYWGAGDTTTLCQSGRIVAYARLNDNTLAAWTDSEGEPNLYLREGRWIGETVQLGGETQTSYRAEFVLTAARRVPKAVSRDTVSVNNEILYVTTDGLCAVKTNALTQDRTVQNRTPQLTGDWRDAALALADGRLWVAVGDKVWSLDVNRMVGTDEGYGYEACTMSGLDALCWYSPDGTALYWGTADGRLITWQEERQDVRWDRTAEGQLSVDCASGCLVCDGALALQEGDRIEPNCQMYCRMATQAAIVGDLAYVSAEEADDMYEGESVYRVMDGGMVKADIVAVDKAKCCVRLSHDEWGECTINLYRRMNDRPIYVYKREGNTVSVGRKNKCERIELAETTALTTAKWVHSEPVRCVWRTAAIDMNNAAGQKELTGVSVAYEGRTSGNLQVSVRSSATDRHWDVKGMRSLDWRWVDLGRWVTQDALSRVYTKRLKMRCHYVQLTVTACGGYAVVKGVQLLYRSLKTKGGVGE